MRPFRPTLIAAVLLIGASQPVLSGEFVGLRTSYRNFNIGRVARSTILEGGGVVDVVRDELSGMFGLGGEYLNVSNRFIYNLSFDYSTTRLPGRPSESYRYVFSDGNGNVTEASATVTSQIARMNVGVGYSLTSLPSAFAYVNPMLSFEWGTWVTLDDATDRFVQKGNLAPAELHVDARARVGLNLRLLVGVAISETTSLAIAPSWRYGWDVSQRATDAGLVGDLSNDRALTFDFEFGLYRAIAR